MPVTADELNNSTTLCIKAVLEKEGITAESLTKDLKRELKAKETKIVKVKRDAKADEVIRQILEQTGENKKPSKIKVIYETTEETVIAVDFINWGTRQSARMDAHKLRGDYPSQKMDLTIKPLLVMDVDGKTTDKI